MGSCARRGSYRPHVDGPLRLSTIFRPRAIASSVVGTFRDIGRNALYVMAGFFPMSESSLQNETGTNPGTIQAGLNIE